MKLPAKFTGSLRSLAKYQGGWVQIILFIVSLIISIVLAPKPASPRAAALDDFDVPVAEEDRNIPVLFGTKRITGANICWYGDLDVQKIKKSSTLGGSQTVGFKYFLGLHMVFCMGPVDKFTKIEAGDKEAWTGNATGNSTISINQPGLFGGDQKGGGLVGMVDWMFGADDQAANDYLDAKTPGALPGFRGVAGLAFHSSNFGFSSGSWNEAKIYAGGGRGGYVGTRPYVDAWAVTATRILKGWQSDTVWYPEKAAIGTSMNAAHIVYECLTNAEWGQGSPTSLIDDDNFRDVADQLYDEGFGLDMLWSQSTTIEAFMQIVMDHIAGILGYDVITGKYVIRLIRGGYNHDALPTFDPSNAISATNFQRRSWGETVNELTIGYTDSATGQETSIIVQDLGNIRSQQARIPDKINREGITSVDLIRVVAGRELASRSTPLARMDMTVNRVGWSYAPGDVIKAIWPEFDLPLTVMRVIAMRKGNLEKRSITVSLVEDIYALSGIEYTEEQPDNGVPDIPPGTPDAPENGGTVISTALGSPPLSGMIDGDRYLVASPASGDWAGHAGDIAEWDEDNDQWIFSEVPDGTILYDDDEEETVQVIGGTPQGFGGGAAITLVDEDASPDEVIDPVETIFIKGAEVQDMGTGGVRIVVSPATTKGDIATRTAAGGYARIPVGTEGQYPRARAAELTGIKWENSPPVGEGASGCRVYMNATQAIADSTLTALTWPVEEYDTDGYHSTGVNTSRFTVAVDGKYTLGCAIKWDSNTTGTRELYIVVNGVTATRKAGSFLPASAGLVQSVVDTLSLVAGDYVEFFVNQNSTASRNITNAEQIASAFIARVGVTAAPTLMRGATWVRTVGNIQTPVNDVHVRCPVKGLITGVTVGTTGGPGSCAVDIWKDTHANYPPTVADTICASAKPTISSGVKYEDTALTGWTTAVAAGDWLVFHLDSSAAFKAIFVQLYIKETQ